MDAERFVAWVGGEDAETNQLQYVMNRKNEPSTIRQICRNIEMDEVKKPLTKEKESCILHYHMIIY